MTTISLLKMEFDHKKTAYLVDVLVMAKATYMTFDGMLNDMLTHVAMSACLPSFLSFDFY